MDNRGIPYKKSVKMSIGEFSKRGADRLAIVLEDQFAVRLHHRMKKGSGRNDDDRSTLPYRMEWRYDLAAHREPRGDVVHI